MRTCTVCLMALAVFVFRAQAEPLVLVEDGRPRAAIILQADDPMAQEAGEAIQKYVEKMSGARLPVFAENEEMDVEAAVWVHVGQTTEVRQMGLDVPSGHDPSVREDAFEEEGYVLRTVGDRLVVAGNNDGPYQGTLYAAYALLERLGCR